MGDGFRSDRPAQVEGHHQRDRGPKTKRDGGVIPSPPNPAHSGRFKVASGTEGPEEGTMTMMMNANY
jgi:hypothetical protein